MAFFKKPEKSSGKKFRRAQYIKTKEGRPVTIQILDEHPTLIYKHWMRDASGRWVGVWCLGDACPICHRNERINWNRDHPDYISRSRRYRVNVLDLTPTKVCPDCGAEYHPNTAPNTCVNDACNTDLSQVDAAPLMRVKIMEKGIRLMEQLAALEKEVHPFTQQEMRIQEYPVKLITHGSGTDTVIAVTPQMPNDELDLQQFEDKKFDLEEEGLKLNAEEIEYLMNGGRLSEVLSARSAEESISESSDQEDATEDIPF
jgi:hypothetical protein